MSTFTAKTKLTLSISKTNKQNQLREVIQTSHQAHWFEHDYNLIVNLQS